MAFFNKEVTRLLASQSWRDTVTLGSRIETGNHRIIVWFSYSRLLLLITLYVESVWTAMYYLLSQIKSDLSFLWLLINIWCMSMTNDLDSTYAKHLMHAWEVQKGGVII